MLPVLVSSGAGGNRPDAATSNRAGPHATHHRRSRGYTTGLRCCAHAEPMAAATAASYSRR